MKSQRKSSVRQRATQAAMRQPPTSEFTSCQSGLDERTLVKLLGNSSLTTCMYRAKELLSFLFERLLSIWPRLIPVIIFPLIVTLFMTFALTSLQQVMKKVNIDTIDNKKRLQFVFIVITSCYSLILLAVAVDYSKLIRISQTAIEYLRQRAAEPKTQEMGSTNLDSNDMLFAVQTVKERQQVGLDTPSKAEDNQQVLTFRNNDDANSSNNFGSFAIDSRNGMNWWHTYAFLRMGIHCVIFKVIHAFNVLFQISSHKRQQQSRFTHYLLRPIHGEVLRLIILAGLIIAVVLGLTLQKGFKLAVNKEFATWLPESSIWTASVACYLQLHFITLLVIAVLASRSPSEIHVSATLCRWFLTLLFCLVVQLSVIPSVFELPKCLLLKRLDNGFFAVFTDIEGYSDSPIVNSLGASRPKVIFLLGSLITAIIASFLYQLNALQMSLGSVGTLFEWLLSVSPIEGIVLLLSLFATQTNFLILIMPFLGKLSEAELFCIFVLMLVKTPSEDDEYWNYMDTTKYGSVLQPRVHDQMHTYIPQRMVIRSMLAFPLIILFCRIIYPLKGKFCVRASLFRRLYSMNCGRPFSSLGESLLHYVAYCLRSLCRYFVMILFLHCLEFMFRFGMQTIELRFDYSTVAEEALIEILSMPVALLTDTTELYPCERRPLSNYIIRRFIYPKETFHRYFLLTTTNGSVDPILQQYNSLSMPAKEIVVSGTFNWDTIVVFVAFTTDCLDKDHRVTLWFLFRGCIAAILIYAAMHNLLLLICEPDALRQFYKVSRDWMDSLDYYLQSAGNCTTNSDPSI